MSPGLYTLERPESFGFVAAEAPHVRELARLYGADPMGAPQRISKCNQRTELYALETSLGRLMLRSAEEALADTLEAQCAIACAAASCGLVRPLEAGGSHVVRLRDRAWIAYRAVEGSTYDGRNASLDDVLLASWNLLAQLRTFEVSTLPRCGHEPSLWGDTFDALTDREACLHALEGSGTALSPATIGLLEAQRRTLLALAARVAALAPTLAPAIVHNDLQHANVIACAGRISFVDIEDLCLEAPQIALMHGVFKMLRHLVYCGVISAAEARARLPAIEQALVSHPAWTGACGKPFDYAALRIVSDVAEILAAWTRAGDSQDLYDLEKRIHNLLELLDLYEEKKPWN